MSSNRVFLLLGTNLGNKLGFIDKAKVLLSKNVGYIIKVSSIYESESWGYESQNNFLNQVVEIKTSFAPLELLQKTQFIEKEMGRTKALNTSAYEDRVIDIDVLFYNNEIIETPDLVIPHQEIENRNFVLAPLVELAPLMIHPKLKKTLEEVYQLSGDKSSVWKYEL